VFQVKIQEQKRYTVDVRVSGNTTPLHLACGAFSLKDSVEIAAFLLEHGANVNAVDDSL
jgi:ankyrin repeat protein